MSTVSTLVTSLVAIAALLFTGLSLQQTREQNQIAQSGQITDRFNAAIANLASASETIRIGGIYALQRIMLDSPRDQPAVIEVLAAFVRENRPLGSATETPPPSATGWLSPHPPTDVQAALTTLADRDPAADQGTVVDLEATNLSYADLTDAKFADVELDSSNLTGAVLDGADLSTADLAHADLRGATAEMANLTEASLPGADLTDTDFTGADLDDANLTHTDIAGARFAQADLEGVQLFGAASATTSADPIPVATSTGG